MHDLLTIAIPMTTDVTEMVTDPIPTYSIGRPVTSKIRRVSIDDYNGRRQHSNSV